MSADLREVYKRLAERREVESYVFTPYRAHPLCPDLFVRDGEPFTAFDSGVVMRIEPGISVSVIA